MKRQMKIIHNRARCKNCGQTIESFHVHDWVCCPCFHSSNGETGIFVDGGKEYRRIGGHQEYFEDLSEVRPYTDEERDEYNEAELRRAEEFGSWYKPHLMD